MKPTSTMTIDECRDELAANAGWTHATSGCYFASDLDGARYQMHALADDWLYHRSGKDAQRHHPIPRTLDEAAKLPSGWSIMLSQDRLVGKDLWVVSAFDGDITKTDVCCQGTTELEARFRLRVEVERSLREGGKEQK